MSFSSLPVVGDLQSTGTLSALNSILILEASGASGSIINVSGTWVGTIVVEGSNDRFATTQNVTLWSPPVGFITTGLTANGYYRLAAIAGFTQIRARMSVFTSGSALVVMSTSLGTATVAALSPNASSFKNSSSTNDGVGNAITSQISGSQRALDIGIDVAGVQVDPRSIRLLTSSDTVAVQALSSSGVTINGLVTANIGTTGGLALDTTVAKLNITQGTALSSNTGPMIQASVSATTPSYTTGNISPLSLTTSGALRVDASATTSNLNAQVTGASANGTTISPNPVIVGGLTPSGTVNTIALDSLGNLKVSVVPSPDIAKQYFTLDSGLVSAAIGVSDLSTDNAVMLISNPSSSTKTLSIIIRIYGVSITNVACMFRIYVDPTVISNGVSRAIRPGTAGNSATSVASAFTLPVVSSFGSLLDSYIISQNSSGSPIQENQVLQLPPGHKWLITAAPSSNARTVDIGIKWLEQ